MDTIWVPEVDATLKPKYKAVVKAIRDAIAAGALGQGTSCPLCGIWVGSWA